MRKPVEALPWNSAIAPPVDRQARAITRGHILHHAQIVARPMSSAHLIG
jgi:hypothetical protein